MNIIGVMVSKFRIGTEVGGVHLVTILDATVACIYILLESRNLIAALVIVPKDTVLYVRVLQHN